MCHPHRIVVEFLRKHGKQGIAFVPFTSVDVEELEHR